MSVRRGIPQLLAAFACFAAMLPMRAPGQDGANAAAAAAPTSREAAPIDLTGYWTALITDDWQYRMIVPARGDYSWLPINAAARAVAERWDPAADTEAGEACKAYAAPAIMRLPTRLRISWSDDETLIVETDTGSQVRTFHFNAAAERGDRTWQGHSVAAWDFERPRNARRRIFEDTSGSGSPNAGNLRVETENLRAGYLRKNGVPFSEQTRMTEHFNILNGQREDRYLAVQTFVEDPVYLTRHFVRTLLFRAEEDGRNWHPTACAADGWGE